MRKGEHMTAEQKAKCGEAVSAAHAVRRQALGHDAGECRHMRCENCRIGYHLQCDGGSCRCVCALTLDEKWQRGKYAK